MAADFISGVTWCSTNVLIWRSNPISMALAIERIATDSQILCFDGTIF
ncbi:MAG: hypothetical protein JRF72_23370 [Deltaproteobacteria bacterium]|nr:hypothetical protein [Deltaproteobacteria bacterium]